MIGLLSAINPGDEIFKKGYSPNPAYQKPSEVKNIPNNNGFFDGLNTLNAKDLAVRNSLHFLSKRERAQMNLDRYKLREQQSIEKRKR